MGRIFLFLFGISLFFGFNNCGENFRSNQNQVSSLSETPDLEISGCSENDPRSGDIKILSLAGPEYLAIAEDLFPSQDHSTLSRLTQALPLNSNIFPGTQEIQPISGFVLDKRQIADYFSENLINFIEEKGLCSDFDESCRSLVIDQFLYKIFRKPIDPEFKSQILSTNQSLPFEYFVKFIFLSPEFHLKAYPRQLTPYDLVVKMSMSLFGTFPDDLLIERRDEIFKNAELMKLELKRLLSDPKMARRFSQKFWGKWLSIDQLTQMHLPENIGFDSLDHLEKTYQRIEFYTSNQKSLKNLFYSPNQSKIPLSPITSAAFAMASSRVLDDQVQTYYVLRGVNIASKLLCIEMPNLPQALLEEINQTKELTQDLSALETIHFHRSKPQCSSCHSIFDPIGVSMEQLNPFGNFREFFSDGSKIEKTGTLFNKPYHDLNSFVELIASSGALHSCFIQNLQTLSDGLFESRNGACRAQEIYAQGHISILESLTKFFSSQHFISRDLNEKQYIWSQRRKFIENLYLEGLERNFSDQEIESWLDIYTKSGAESVATGILLSPELTALQDSNSKFTNKSYRLLLGRYPSMAEAQWAAAELEASGRQGIVNGILESDEFKTNPFY